MLGANIGCADIPLNPQVGAGGGDEGAQLVSDC